MIKDVGDIYKYLDTQRDKRDLLDAERARRKGCERPADSPYRTNPLLKCQCLACEPFGSV